ncbi:Ig-like domain-containing protein [Halobacillus litoralis]|uniref:RCC1 domain-containing protein n=1 Tax=Halobacillus litoralis TaxID=45668 RepID=UPI001CD54A99|nr:Ig-like domain-containing protein [Halobacillus litoralis]MCA0971506.1 Ig-like domain-containing protein [Halobacillus litoralis]
MIKWKVISLFLIVLSLSFIHQPVHAESTISVYGKHTLTLIEDDDGELHLLGWGWNAFDQLTIKEKQTSVPREIGTGEEVIESVEAGDIHSLVLTEYGEVFSFGSNDNGQAGTGEPSTTEPELTQVMAFEKDNSNEFTLRKLSNITQISAGDSHSLALKADGTVWSFGSNQFGQLGQHEFKATGEKVTAEQILGLEDIVEIESFQNHNLALDEEGTVWAWGENWGGQMPVSFAFTKTPYEVEGLPKIKGIATGSSHSLALDEDGGVWAWGRNDFGLNAAPTDFATPFLVPSLPEIEHVAAGAYHNLALDTDGNIWSWGDNSVGELGYAPSSAVTQPPSQIAGINDVVEVDAGTRYSIAKTEDGDIYTWGLNDYGQLGDGSADNRGIPNNLTLTLAQGVEIDRETITLEEGDDAELNARLIPEGSVFTEIEWSSSNPDMVSVSDDGRIEVTEDMTRVEGNRATITASILDGKYEDTIEVIIAVPVSGVELNKKSVTLERVPEWLDVQEDSIQLEALVYPYNATDKRIIWDSEDPDVATVNTQGEVTSVSEGKTTITATTIDGGYSDSVEIEVNVPVDRIFIKGNEHDLYLEQEEQYQLEYRIYPLSATDQYVYEWESSKPSVVKVKQNGKIEAVSEGTAEITVTTLYKRKKGSITVHVYDDDYTELSAFNISDDPIEVDAEDTVKLNPTFYPSRATNKELHYESLNTEVATVTSNGRVRGVSTGSTIIRARSADTGKVDTVRVIVGPSKDGWAVMQTDDSVSRQKYWIVTFNQDIDPDSIDNRSVYIREESSTRKHDIKAEIIGGRTLYIIPEDRYDSNEDYELYITDDVETEDGEALSQPIKFKFSTN